MTELRKIKNKTSEELKDLVRDIVQSRVFLLEHLPPDDVGLVKSVFMPIAFGALSGIDPKTVGTLFEYIENAGPRGVNGYPSFMSVQILSKHDWDTIRPLIAKQYESLAAIEIPGEEQVRIVPDLELSKEWIDYLYHWQYGGSSAFSAMLFDLITKADPGNKARIRMGFPEAVAVWEAWYNHPTGSGFFEEHGIKIKE